MAVTSGFFNSLYGDRKYNAEQFSAMFDNLITDGVFSNVGNAFQVTADGSNVLIDVGRAWFNSVWVYNDTLYPLPVQPSEVLLDRIDAVVIEINHTEAIRAGRIFFVQGTASADPERPVLTDTEDIHQYPLAYVYRKAGASTVTQADITNMIGTSSCPYVTGILATQDIDKVVAQWEAQFNQWFEDLQIELSGDVAANLASQIIEIDARFEELARTGRVYEDLQDSNNDTILDSQSRVIEGSTSFRQRNEDPPSGTGTSGDVNNLKMDIVRLEQVNSNIAPKVGDILVTVRTNPGSGWVLCNGAAVSRGSYPELSPLIPFSPDGPWTGLIPDTTGGTYGVLSILKMAYGNGYYAGVQNGSHAAVYIGYSTDLASWNTYNLDNAKTDGTMTINVYGYTHCITFGNGHFVVPAYEYVSDRYVMRFYYSQYPHTGWNCTDVLTGVSDDDNLPKFQDITFANGYFVVVAHDGRDSSRNAICYVSTSPSGPWTKYTMLTQISSWDSYYVTPSFVKFVNGYFVSGISSYQGKTGIAWREGNPNGGWSFTQIDTDTLFYVAYNSCTIEDCIYANGKYALLVRIGHNNDDISAILESSSLSGPWTLSSIIGNYGANSLCFINGFYMVEGDGGVMKTAVLYSRFSTGPWVESVFTTNLLANGLLYANNRLIRYGSSLMNIDSTNMKLPAISTGGPTYTYIKAQS